jgi:glycerol-3-phosphate dehydrogenase
MHVRLLVPPKGRAPVWPMTLPDGRLGWPTGEDTMAVRIYTIRSIDVDRAEMDIDFVLHESGGVGMPGADFERFLAVMITRYSSLPRALVRRLARAYGTLMVDLLGDATQMDELGEDFGGGLTEREVDYLVEREWAVTAEDVLFRRSKLGLHVPDDTASRLAAYLQDHHRVRGHDPVAA